MAKGGARDGAGRTKGKKDLFQRALLDAISFEDKQKFVLKAYKDASKDKDLRKFFLEQFLGKAPQQINADLTTMGEQLPPAINITVIKSK